MRGYVWPRTARGRLYLAAYVAVEALLGLSSVTLSYPLSSVANAVGYILMAPTTILALPVVNAVEARVFSGFGYSSTTLAVTLAVLFALGALVNACLIVYLRTSDPRF
jgi:hypothetical protein